MLDKHFLFCYYKNVKREVKKMKTRTWWFEDTETGEEFFVENEFADRSQSKAEAQKTAHKYFESPRLIAQISLASADAMGYDTY